MDDPLISAFVGATIALVAAFLASLTDVLKRRWSVRTETASWRRQTMFTFTHEYVEAAFVIAGTAGNARKERMGGRSLAELQRHLDECHRAHGQMIAALTALRLVAPKDVVIAAETVHESCHYLINLAMGGREPNTDVETSDERWEQLKASAREDRSNLVIAVRRAFGIETDAVPFGARIESSWTIPADCLSLSRPIRAGQVDVTAPSTTPSSVGRNDSSSG